MMNQPSKQSEVEGDGSDQKEGGATEMPQAKEQVEVEECWDPDETDEEKERARKMGPKVGYMLCRCIVMLQGHM